MNFAVLASGHGGNLQAIIDAVKAGKIKARLTAVISDKKDAYALHRAQQAGIPAVHMDPKDHPDRESYDRAVIDRLHGFKADFVVLAGYMRLVSIYFIQQYPHRILNIHPSLLPSFKGTHAIRDAFDHGVKVTGASVHFVVEAMDDGPIIIQEAVPIGPDDSMESLEEKVHQAEHRIYPAAIDLFIRGKLKIEGRRVIVAD
jgi:phosphoribosylglycinamide formyltransferase 1